MNMKRYSFFLPDELKRRLEQTAARTGTPASEHIRAAIDMYCDVQMGYRVPPVQLTNLASRWSEMQDAKPDGR